MFKGTRSQIRNVAVGGGMPFTLGVDDPAIMERFRTGKITPEEYTIALKAHIKNKGGKLLLDKGYQLGIGVGSEAGNIVRSAPESYVKEYLRDVEYSHEGYFRLHMTQDISPIEGFKTFGIKATNKARKKKLKKR